jgi:hypothetical protein
MKILDHFVVVRYSFKFKLVLLEQVYYYHDGAHFQQLYQIRDDH